MRVVAAISRGPRAVSSQTSTQHPGECLENDFATSCVRLKKRLITTAFARRRLNFINFFLHVHALHPL